MHKMNIGVQLVYLHKWTGDFLQHYAVRGSSLQNSKYLTPDMLSIAMS